MPQSEFWSKDQKAKYVKGQAKDKLFDQFHHCHWPGCQVVVHPAKWGCYDHWMLLPNNLRTALWQAYRPGQEITKTPSREYVQAAIAIRNWILQHYPAARETMVDTPSY